MRCEELKNAVDTFESITVDTLKLDWLRNLTLQFESVDLAKDY